MTLFTLCSVLPPMVALSTIPDRYRAPAILSTVQSILQRMDRANLPLQRLQEAGGMGTIHLHMVELEGDRQGRAPKT